METSITIKTVSQQNICRDNESLDIEITSEIECNLECNLNKLKTI